MLPYCKFHGIGVIPYSPLAGGLLARPRESAETPRHKLSSSLGLIKIDQADTEIIKRVEEIAKKRGWTMSQVCRYIHPSCRSGDIDKLRTQGRPRLGTAQCHQPYFWRELCRAC